MGFEVSSGEICEGYVGMQKEDGLLVPSSRIMSNLRRLLWLEIPKLT